LHIQLLTISLFLVKKYEEENKKLERKLEERPNIPIGYVLYY